MKLVIKLADEIYEMKKPGIIEKNINEIISAVIFGRPLPKGCGRLLDENMVKQKLFDITDLYDSGKYLVFEDNKYLIGDNIQNDNRRILSLNEALQGVINGIPAIIEADAESEDKE